ncbi:hypothetical protein E2562_032815 [Oryza meyeriana var. granulata]|uniref:Uncharacterized protein n=1 Tax=Oryza meyeriana var. granulata TaxID=110450 RepID=A0A6G1DR09_9ORYZ|nr:hypothetical protein E2562_032815 [Oryza meyeriana var. granulata]
MGIKFIRGVASYELLGFWKIGKTQEPAEKRELVARGEQDVAKAWYYRRTRFSIREEEYDEVDSLDEETDIIDSDEEFHA